MTLALEIYTKAERGAREEHARLVRQFMAGKIDICSCGIDMERNAIIAAFDAALRPQPYGPIGYQGRAKRS